jgi:Cu+-exporting ATPase
LVGRASLGLKKENKLMCCCATKPKTEANDAVTDVVCGTQVDPATAVGVSENQKKKYLFCGTGCKRSFDANPVQYA